MQNEPEDNLHKEPKTLSIIFQQFKDGKGNTKIEGAKNFKSDELIIIANTLKYAILNQSDLIQHASEAQREQATTDEQILDFGQLLKQTVQITNSYLKRHANDTDHKDVRDIINNVHSLFQIAELNNRLQTEQENQKAAQNAQNPPYSGLVHPYSRNPQTEQIPLINHPTEHKLPQPPPDAFDASAVNQYVNDVFKTIDEKYPTKPQE